VAANRRKRSTGASRAEPAPGNWLKPYLAGCVSGLLLAFFFYLVTLPPEGTGTAASAEQPTPAQAAAPQPSFDFYEVLPEQRIDVDVDPADLPQARDRDDGPVYLLQAGSFRQADDADRRRAELLLLGLEPRVEETTGSNGRWYRVVIGPFESRSAMARARSLTAQQEIDTLLMQRKRG
jgi:cell division protein FtsN